MGTWPSLRATWAPSFAQREVEEPAWSGVTGSASNAARVTRRRGLLNHLPRGSPGEAMRPQGVTSARLRVSRRTRRRAALSSSSYRVIDTHFVARTPLF
jgi:hypothetical protein